MATGGQTGQQAGRQAKRYCNMGYYLRLVETWRKQCSSWEAQEEAEEGGRKGGRVEGWKGGMVEGRGYCSILHKESIGS
jgi:hypothetical protein